MEYDFRLKISQSALRGKTREERLAIYKFVRDAESAVRKKLQAGEEITNTYWNEITAALRKN